MNEVLDTAQADVYMNALYAYHARARRQQQETWKKHANTFPRLRIGLAKLTRPGRKSVQNTLEIARSAREYGAGVATKIGVSVGMQMLQQLRLYQKHRVPADSYYFLGMYAQDVRQKARFFLGDALTSTILHHLAATAPDDAADPLHEKETFWKHCHEHGLPAVPVLAVFHSGSLQQDYGNLRDALPPQDLFSKPTIAYLGQGSRKWTYQGERGFSDSTGRMYTPSAVLNALKRQSRDKTLLLQPCVHDHPRLRTLTGSVGPSTVRIVTIRKPDAPPEYFAGLLTTPTHNVPAPTFKGRTALAARIDADTGQLDRPWCKRAAYLLKNRDRHPKTGTRMTGFELPHWHETKNLALQAHATLPGIACVGWDIVLTADGPRLLEGNNDCSATLTQITHQRLLGLTRLPAYLNAHIYTRARPCTDAHAASSCAAIV